MTFLDSSFPISAEYDEDHKGFFPHLAGLQKTGNKKT